MARLLVAAALMAPGQVVESTSYCLSGTMADGSYVRPGSAANNWYPLGTRIWVEPAVHGTHQWVVRDRIGWGTSLDFWVGSCSAAVAYGRRAVRIRVGWKQPRETIRRKLVRVRWRPAPLWLLHKTRP